MMCHRYASLATLHGRGWVVVFYSWAIARADWAHCAFRNEGAIEEKIDAEEVFKAHLIVSLDVFLVLVDLVQEIEMLLRGREGCNKRPPCVCNHLLPAQDKPE